MQLMTAMVGKLELSTEPLPQDLTEGVEEDEWVSLLSLSVSLSLLSVSLCVSSKKMRKFQIKEFLKKKWMSCF